LYEFVIRKTSFGVYRYGDDDVPKHKWGFVPKPVITFVSRLAFRGCDTHRRDNICLSLSASLFLSLSLWLWNRISKQLSPLCKHSPSVPTLTSVSFCCKQICWKVLQISNFSLLPIGCVNLGHLKRCSKLLSLTYFYFSFNPFYPPSIKQRLIAVFNS
jgi:hypothetical protein